MMTTIAAVLAFVVLGVLVREFADSDPIKAKAYPVRWHLWLVSGLFLSCGMLARIATVIEPSIANERIAAVLTLFGLAVRVCINRRRGGNV